MVSQDMYAAIRRQIRTDTSAPIADLTDRAATLQQRADAVEGRAQTLEQRATAVEDRAGTLETAVAALPHLSFRTVTLTLPLLAVGSTEIAVTWDIPFVAADYGVLATIEAGVLALGKLTAGVKANSRTQTGCVIALANAALIAVQAGAQLHVLAWRVLGQGLH